MLVSDNDRGRPLAGAASNVISDGDDFQSTRCRRCGHRLSARVSVDLGIGPKCRHLEGEPDIVFQPPPDPYERILLATDRLLAAIERLEARIEVVV